MCVHGSQAVYCTTELCLSVDKLKEEEKTTTGKERCPCTEVNVYVVCNLSTVKTENTYTDGDEKADEFTKAGAMLDEGFMAQTRANTVQQEREEVYAALKCAAGFHCLVKERQDFEELKPQPKEQCTCGQAKRGNTASNGTVYFSVSKYRCLRCGRGSKYTKMEGKCTGPKYLAILLGK